MLKSDYIPGGFGFTAFLMMMSGLDCFVADSRIFFISAADGEFKLFKLGLLPSVGGCYSFVGDKRSTEREFFKISGDFLTILGF